MDNSKNSSGRSSFGIFVGIICIWMIFVCVIISVFEERPGLFSKLFVKGMMSGLIVMGYIFKSPKDEVETVKTTKATSL